METPRHFEPSESNSILRRVVGGCIAGLQFVGRQLATSDQSPHEGRLRASVMPVEYMQIPDQPPIHDDTI